MSFGMVSGVGRGIGVLDRGDYLRRKGAVLGVNLGLCDAALLKLLWAVLVLFVTLDTKVFRSIYPYRLAFIV